MKFLNLCLSIIRGLVFVGSGLFTLEVFSLILIDRLKALSILPIDVAVGGMKHVFATFHFVKLHCFEYLSGHFSLFFLFVVFM